MGTIRLDGSDEGASPATTDAETTGKAAGSETTGDAPKKEEKVKKQGSEALEEQQGKTDDEEGQVVDVQSKHISVNEEGLFVYRVDPEDPKSTFYTGKDYEELMENVSKGIAEKDATLRKRKVSDRLRDADEHVDRAANDEGQGERAPLIEPPDKQEILRAAYKNAEIPLSMVTMTAEQWVKYAEEKGLRDWQVSELRASIKEVYEQAMDVYADRNITFVNSQIFQDEIQAIAEALENSEVDPDEFDLEEVVEAVKKNPANYKNGGVVKSGRFTAEANKIIRSLEKPKVVSKVREQLEETIARGDEVKAKVKQNASGAQGSQFKKSTTSPKNSEIAYQEGIEMFKDHMKRRKS